MKVNCLRRRQQLDVGLARSFQQRGVHVGAMNDRVGRCQVAHEGTLYLDEIAEIPMLLQGKLLRVLQEGEFERVGEDRTRRVDVRIIAATNRNLRHEVAAGRFREDLFFRLSVFPLETPTLRSRREDIPILAAYFLRQVATRSNLSMPRLTPTNVQALTDYSWPGNLRELQNVVERAVILSKGGALHLTAGKRREFTATVVPVLAQQWLESQRATLRQPSRKAAGKFTGKVVRPNCLVYVRPLCHRALRRSESNARAFKHNGLVPTVVSQGAI